MHNFIAKNYVKAKKTTLKLNQVAQEYTKCTHPYLKYLPPTHGVVKLPACSQVVLLTVFRNNSQTTTLLTPTSFTNFIVFQHFHTGIYCMLNIALLILSCLHFYK